MLHLVQSEEGYVSPAGIAFCAEAARPHQGRGRRGRDLLHDVQAPPDRRLPVSVCTNTLCAVLGGDEIFETLKDHLGVGHDETTADGTITLEHVECLAACDYAPVVTVN